VSTAEKRSGGRKKKKILEYFVGQPIGEARLNGVCAFAAQLKAGKKRLGGTRDMFEKYGAVGNAHSEDGEWKAFVARTGHGANWRRARIVESGRGHTWDDWPAGAEWFRPRVG